MTTFLICASVLIFCIVYSYYIKPHYREFNHLKREKVYSDTTDLWKKGGTHLNGKMVDYDLRSWDGGKNWYVINYNFDTHEFKVVGLVDSIYPGLMDHIAAWDKLTNYVEKNGPIKLDDPNGVKALEGAGFTLTKK